jgi:acid phosphatase
MLTRPGKLEATKLGVDIEQRYQGLRTPKNIWTPNAERAVNGAKSLAAGPADDTSDIQVLQISEGRERVSIH